MILAIDTSTQWMGLALFDGGRVLYEKIWRTSRRHTVELVPAIQTALAESGVEVGSLKAVAAALGPGSFTSLRIGLASAKGLSFSLKIPLIGVPSLDITAHGQTPDNKPLICVLRAGRGRLAAQSYRQESGQWKAEGEVFMTTAPELESAINEPTIISGELDAEERGILARRWRNALIAEPPDCLRRPSRLAFIAWKRLDAGEADDPASLAPIYLRTASTPGN